MITWRLKELLKEHGITAYALAAETAGALSRNAIYRLTKGPPARVELATLEALITALRRLTGQPIGVEDLLTLEEENGRASTTTRKARPSAELKGDPR